MDCNENAAPTHTIPNTRGWNEVTASSSGLPGQQSQTRPCRLDNGVSNATDQQANVPCLDDNSPSPNGLLTWKDLSPSHKKYSTGEKCNDVETAPSNDEDKQPVLITWGKKSSSGELSDDQNQPHSLLTWKNISPTRLSKNAFGFSSPDSSDSDTVRHYTVNGTASAPPMQESSSDTSVGTCSPTHGARGGSGSDGSTYLPSPEDGCSNEYFYDEDFSVKFDSNLKDSLVETVPSEGVSTPSILEFSDTMTIDVNQASSTIDGSFRRSRYDSEISVSDHRSCDLSPSDRGMMCSSDVLQISDGPLFTPTPTNEFPPAISTDSLDRGSKGLTASTSTSETAKTIVDCGTKKELYMLSFFNHKGKQTTSLASVASQASWSSEQQLSRSNSNCTSQEDLDGSVSASLQTHFSFNRGGNSLTRKPSSGKCGPAPSRSRSEGSGIARRHLSTATSTESVDATEVDPNSERSGRLTSWKTVKQRRKVTGQSPQTSSPKPKSKSMPDLYMQNWLDKMAGCAETQTDSQDADVEQTCSSAEQLKGSATSLVELYHKMRPDRFSDQNLSEDSVSVSTQSKDSVFSDCDTGRNTPEVKDSNSQTAASLPFRTTAIPPRFYTYSSESETSADCRHRKACHSLERRRTGAVTSPQHSEPGGYSRQTLPRAYKRSVSSPGRCGHACSSGATEKQTQCPSQFALEPVTVWRGTKNFSAQFPPNTRDCGIQTAPDNQKQHNLTDREMQTSPDKPSQPFGSVQSEDGESAEVFYTHPAQTSPTRLSRSANVRRPVDDETFPKRFPLLRPHSIGAIGEEDERRFPTYDAVVSRCAVREKRGASLSPNRSDKPSFYSHRSLPDLSFLTTHSPKTSPVQPVPPEEDPETQTEPDLEAHTQGQTNPVFYLPKLGTSHSHSAMSSAGAVRKIPQNFHPFVAHHHHSACAHQGRQADAEQNHQAHHRHGRTGRGEPGRKNSSGHAPHSASSSSGFSTSSTSSGIDPGYHDNRRSPPMAEQFAHGYQAWDSRHKYVETDGGCVYYHSLPNHLPPGFISEEEKMDYYACMCIKPSVQETKMYAYKYERYPESHQHYLPSKSRPHPMDGPAQDGGQELIPEEQSTSSGMGKSDDIFSVHENDQSSSPDEGSRHESHSEEFCRVVPSAPPFNELASNGVVLRRGKNWHHGNHSSETGSSDNLSGGTSSGSSGDDRKPLKSCLRRRRLERRCKSMSLTDPFRLFEGYINPGPRRSPNHRHSYGCDGYPLYMDYLYDAMENSQLGEMMEWYRATYLHDVQLPAGACPCSCSAVPGVSSRQELLVSTDEPASSGDVSGTTTTTTADVNQTSEGNPDDSMEKREKRKSVSFASEVSFHSPLPSPQCSPKHRQGGNATATTTQQAPSVSQQNKGGNWDSTPNTKPGLPVPQLRTNTTSDEDTDDACSDVAPSEFNVTSPRGLSDSHSRDSITACMDKKKVYMSDVCRAAESLVAHFSQSKGTFDKLRLGSCLDTPEVGHLVLSQLCPAIARVISDGLKAYTGGLHVFGRIQITVWRVAEVSAELGPSTRAVHELVKDLRNRSDLVSTRQKFEAFVFGLLNLRLLDFWMGYTRHKDKVVDKLYEADSIMCMSHNSLQQAYEDMLASLQPLAILPFQLDASFIVALHMSRGKSENSMVENPGEKLSGETNAMKQSQPSTSAKTSWSWLGGSVSNTLPKAKSLVSKLHSGAVRSLTMFSSGSSTSSVPITASQDQLDQCLPRNKGGELYISESKIESLDSSASESSRVISPHQNGQIVLNLRQETSDEDSQTESSHGMSKFAAKIFNMAAGKLEKVGPVYRQGMTQYYFEGESSEGGATPKLLTPGTDTSTSGSSAQSPVLTWGEVKKSGKDIKTDGVIPPPKPPRVLQEGKPCLSSTPSTLSEAKIANQKASSPTKPKQQFGLIKLFDRLLLPSSSSKQQQQITEEKPRKRWSWAPLGSKETVQNSESEGVDKRYGSVTTFKGIGVESAHIQTSSSNIEIQKNCEERDTEKTVESESSVEKVKTVIDKKAEAEKLANQITLQDGPVLMLPPKKVVPDKSGCYSGIVQSDKLTLSVTSEADTQQSFSHVDSNANFVNTTVDQVPVNSCSGASNGQGQTGQSTPPAQSSNQHQSTSASHVPTSSSHQYRSGARGESSSDSDQSKSSTPTDQSESSTQPAVAMATRTDEFKLPDYRYWFMYRRGSGTAV